jgi:hypothetical protein
MRGFGKYEGRWKKRIEGYRKGMYGMDHLVWDWEKWRTLLHVVAEFYIS